jgi:hypothetical protein
MTGTASVLLRIAYQRTLGRYRSYPAEQFHNCVSFGRDDANDVFQYIEINFRLNISHRETATESINSASRQIAKLFGPTDGSYSSAAVEAMTTPGIVDREMLGSDGVYDGQLQRKRVMFEHQWQIRRTPPSTSLLVLLQLLDGTS